METTSAPTSKSVNIIIAAGLITGAVLGTAGSMIQPGVMQNLLWEISSLGFIAGCALMSLKLSKLGFDIAAAGFIVLAIAEAVMSSGTADSGSGNAAAFGAGVALYVPGLWMAFIPKGFPAWLRVIGVLASVPFAIAALKIFQGVQVPSTSMFPSIGYTLLTITFLALSWWVLKKQ